MQFRATEPIFDPRPDLPLGGAAGHQARVPEVLRESLRAPADGPVLVTAPESIEQAPAALDWRDHPVTGAGETPGRHGDGSEGGQIVEAVVAGPPGRPVPPEPGLEHALRPFSGPSRHAGPGV